MNRIIIDGDQARLYGAPKAIPTGQVGFSKIGFEFSSEWDGMTKIAQFRQGENKYNVAVENNECTCPNELVKGWVSVRVRGYSETAVIATANEILLPVSTGFQSGGIPPIPPTPDLYQQFLKVTQDQIGDLADLTTEAKDNLVAAINEVAAEIPTVDSTLTKSGQAADAAVVGNRLSSLSKEIADLPQPDWNQNDATQPDYVKNRPLYTGGPVETTFVEESTVSFTRNEYSGFYLGTLQSTFVATVGETYKVSWDGTTYESTCVSSNGYTVIGNLSMRGAGPDTGEPFIMMVHNRVGIEIATADTSASHTFSIGGFIPEVVKIDRKYLPKAAFITYDSSSSTYNSDLTNDELYEIMLNGEQVVLYDQSEKTHYYLKKWRIHPSGRIDLCFVREEFEITLFPDGTIGKTPNE